MPGGFVFNTLSQLGEKVGNNRTWESTLNTYDELHPTPPNPPLIPGKTYNIDAYTSYFAFPPGGGVSEVSSSLRTTSFSVVPEPTTALLVGLGLCSALALRRK